jgi:GT2 family glycosyltransferase
MHLVGLGNGFALRPTVFPKGYSSVRIESLPENVGVPAGLHRLWELATQAAPAKPEDHLIVYLHDDLRLLEKGWDQRVKAAFARDSAVQLAGFSGTTGLGDGNIYRIPYHLTQLSRQGPLLSNLLLHAELHGQRTLADQQVAFVDGFSLALRGSLLEKLNGWSWWPGPPCLHHAYDYGIACQVKRHGGKVWLVPVLCDHGVQCNVTHTRHAGTAMNPLFQNLVKLYGGNGAVHAASHQFVYEQFRDVLPIRL